MNAVFIDLDGTLTDPSSGIVNSIHEAFRRCGLTPRVTPTCELCIGPPIAEILKSLLFPADYNQQRNLHLAFEESFATAGWRDNKLYSGVSAALQTICKEDARVFLATSKPQVHARRIAMLFALSEFFSNIYGSELDGTRSDKTELLTYAARAEGVNPAKAIMIGDRKHDITAGRRLGMRTVGVTYGFGSVGELEEAGAHVLVKRPSELPAAIRLLLHREQI